MTSDLTNLRSALEKKFAANLKCIDQKQINLIITSAIILVSIYITLIVWLHRDFIHPLEEHERFGTQINISAAKQEKIWTTSALDYDQSIMSLFVLWIFALIFGFLVDIFKLPPLLGMMLVGVAFRNIPFVTDSLRIEKSWETILRQIAFVIILIRCGVGLNAHVLKKSLKICALLGLITCTIEAAAIILSTTWILNVPIASTIAFAFVLAANSPAVTVPTMIFLQENGRGTKKGIPTIILASASVDNLYCITAFYVASSLTFASDSPLWYTIAQVPIQLLASIVGGILIGYVLRYFPKNNASSVHFSRSALVLSMSLALYYGTQSFDWRIAGPITILLFSIISSAKWKEDNEKKTRPVEQAFRKLWNLGFQPFLFALIGLLFDFSQMDTKLFITATSIVLTGIIIRILSVLVISYFSNFNYKERLFVSFGFLPKATVQAALAPALFNYCLIDKNCSAYANKLLQTCILSILLTAPIGQLLLQILGRVLLTPKEVHIPTNGTYSHKETVQETDVDESIGGSHQTVAVVN